MMAVLHELQDTSLKLNAKKCLFQVKELHFLSHLIPPSGIKLAEDTLKAIAQALPPEDVTMLLLFLGLTIHYLKFVPHFSTEAMPLCKLQKEVTFVWGEEQQCPRQG